MASIEAAIVEVLKGDTVVNTLTHGAIRPMLGSQLERRPFITYQKTNDDNTPTNSGPSKHSRASIEFGVYGDTQAAVIQLTGELKRIFSSTSAITSQIKIAVSTLEDETDTEQGLEPGKGLPVYVRTITFKFVYRTL